MKFKFFYTILIIVTAIAAFSSNIAWKNKSKVLEDEVIRAAVGKSIPILQSSSYTFINKVHCASCHHSLLTSLVVGMAKQKGLPVEDSFARQRIYAMTGGLKLICDPNVVDNFLNVKLIIPYHLLALAAEKYPPDFKTDIAVAFLISEAKTDGSFPGEYQRAPLEVGDINSTALTIHGIQLYAAPALRPQTEQLVAKTKKWLESRKPESQQELTFQLLGMTWCGSSESIKAEVAAKLVRLQRQDGGWAQLPTMKSDAYATGETMFALYTSGMIQNQDENYQRAMNYLLKTQESSGAWFVQARSYLIQPFTNSHFPPDDENQFISAAATNWATLALMETLPDKKN